MSSPKLSAFDGASPGAMDSRGTSSISVCPTRMRAGGCASIELNRTPSQNEPFVEPGSVMRTPVLITSMIRCVRETALSDSTSSHAGSLPMRYVPFSSSSSFLKSSPETTTSFSAMGARWVGVMTSVGICTARPTYCFFADASTTVPVSAAFAVRWGAHRGLRTRVLACCCAATSALATPCNRLGKKWLRRCFCPLHGNALHVGARSRADRGDGRARAPGRSRFTRRVARAPSAALAAAVGAARLRRRR